MIELKEKLENLVIVTKDIIKLIEKEPRLIEKTDYGIIFTIPLENKRKFKICISLKEESWIVNYIDIVE